MLNPRHRRPLVILSAIIVMSCAVAYISLKREEPERPAATAGSHITLEREPTDDRADLYREATAEEVQEAVLDLLLADKDIALSPDLATSLANSFTLSYQAYCLQDVHAFKTLLDEVGLEPRDVWSKNSTPTSWKFVTQTTGGARVAVSGIQVFQRFTRGKEIYDAQLEQLDAGGGVATNKIGQPPRGQNDIVDLAAAGADAYEIVIPAVLRRADTKGMVNAEPGTRFKATLGVTFARKPGSTLWIPVQTRIIHGSEKVPVPVVNPPLR